MDLFNALVVGLIVGWLASRLMGAGRYGLLGDMVAGIIGTFTGGWLATQFLHINVTGVTVTSTVVAVVGAVLLILVYRAVTPGRRDLAQLPGS